MIKVLRIINRFNLGGPTYNATFLTCFMSEEFKTELYGGLHEEHEGDALFIPEKYGVTPKILNELERSVNWSNDKEALKKMRQIIHEFKPDIVHTHASKAGAIGRYAAYKENVPVIVHTFHGHVFHSYFGKLKTSIYKTIERYLAKKSDAIIAISPLQKNELCTQHKIASPDKVKVIPLGFDLDRFQERLDEKRKTFRTNYNVADDEVTIGLIGRLTAIKNHNGFLDKLKAVAKMTDKKMTAFIIGDGELRAEIEIKANRLMEKHANLNIVFTSWIKEIDLALPGLDIVALTSLNEGTPVSLIEAQAAGVPVISTNVGGVKDVLIAGETGVVVDSLATKDYENELLALVENKEKRKKMSQNGWNFVKEKFHYKRLCADMEQLYKTLLEKKEK